MYSTATSHLILYCKRSLHKCILTLRHIDHTRTNNGFFKLTEGLLQTHSCFFSQSINVRGLPLTACHILLHYLPGCVRSTVSCHKTPATQARIKGGGATGEIAPGPSWWNLFVSNKILVWKISWFRSDTRIQLYIISLCYVKHQGPPTATDFSTSLTVCQF